MAAIIVTGAGGFVGKAIVAAARKAGHSVRAFVRNSFPLSWEDDPNIQIIIGDLVEGFDLGPIGEEDIVIHAAASLIGDDTAHDRDTRLATNNLLAILPQGVRLVLVSSFSVYGYAALQDGVVLDESSDLETKLSDRDAYTRAKIAQERAARGAAAENGLDLRIARPGVIYDAGPKAWTPLLGWSKGSFVITMAPDAEIPSIHVEDCGSWLIALATADRCTLPEDGVVNLVSPATLTRRDWIIGIGLRPLVLPKAAVFSIARLFGAILPSGLRLPKLSARFKPLRYSAALAELCLGPLPARDLLAALKDPPKDYA